MSMKTTIRVMVGKRTVIVTVTVAALLLGAWGFLRPPSEDTVQSLFFVLGPGAVSWIIAILAGNFARSRSFYILCGVVAVLFLVVQAAALFWAMRLVQGSGGEPARNPFTLTGLVGFVFYIVAFVRYFGRSPRNRDKHEVEDAAC